MRQMSWPATISVPRSEPISPLFLKRDHQNYEMIVIDVEPSDTTCSIVRITALLHLFAPLKVEQTLHRRKVSFEGWVTGIDPPDHALGNKTQKSSQLNPTFPRLI